MHDFDRIVDRSKEHSAKYDELTMRFGRDDVYSMWVADMDFEVAEPIQKAVEERAKQNIFGYTTRPESYYEAFVDWYKRRYAFEIDRNWILHSPGVVTTLSAAIRELTQKGDKIIVQTPVYHPFYSVVEKNERQLLKSALVKKNGRYEMNFEQLEQFAEEASCMILCNPHNPVGRVWTKEELQKLGDICIRNNVRVISDEIHGDITFGGRRYTPFASISDEIRNITVTCVSATKSFNLAGLQASFVVAPNKEDFKKLSDFFEILDLQRNNCFSLVATEAAFGEGESWLEEMVDYVGRNIDYVNDFCKERLPMLIPNRPEGTYLLWLDCSALGLSDDELFDFFVNNAKIAVSPGTYFGDDGSGYVRLNLACPRKVIENALMSLEKAIQQSKS